MSILGELLTQLLGEAAVDALSKNKKPHVPLPEGEGNASLGDVSLFSGVLSLLFAGLFFTATLDRVSFTDVGGMAIIVIAVFAFLVGLLAYRTGRKAPKVTRRNLGMARAGTWLSIPAMILSIATIAMCGIRLLQWIR